jgi:uncharacterized Fe-S radical SAM superfamily protein PflX
MYFLVSIVDLFLSQFHFGEQRNSETLFQRFNYFNDISYILTARIRTVCRLQLKDS